MTRAAAPRWPEDATPGAMPGTMRYTGAMMRRLAGRFPLGWKPVAFYPCLNAWDIAPVWYRPVLEALDRLPGQIERLKRATARVLRRLARRLEDDAR